LLPTKGITLPLVSNGGSSMLINLLGIGVLLNISQHATTGAAALQSRSEGPSVQPGQPRGAEA
jgi:cell division protein FtsW (lipid II flippase)